MHVMPLLTCPKCSAAVRLAPIMLAPEDGTQDFGNILKRCPRCQEWSWMTLQPQEA